MMRCSADALSASSPPASIPQGITDLTMCKTDGSVAAAAAELLGVHQHQERSIGHVPQAAPAAAAKMIYSSLRQTAVALGGLTGINTHDACRAATLPS
jgi:hypothetical protein